MGIKNTSIDEESGFVINSDVVLPLFSHESYKIKTTLNRAYEFKGINESPYENSSHFARIHVTDKSNKSIQKYNNKYYQKFFRKDVLWDFGDGTQVEGFSVEHSYRKPGRYKITCTFFDIDRKAWVNDYSITVTVKEVLPTVLRFDKGYTAPEIKCSKVERIARIEALNSNTVDKNLDVIVDRIFTKEQHSKGFEQIGKDYESVKSERFGFMDKYWTLLENKQTLFYNSNEVHSDYLTPSNIFEPKYNEIFGKFFYNIYEDKIDLSLFQVIPYKNIDDNLKTITILEPNQSILDHTEEKYTTFSITQVYSEKNLPNDVLTIGKRGWFDVFYRNDFKSDDNVFTIYYDIETENITGELYSAPNYLNMNPLGFKVNVIGNNVDDVRIGYSLDGFLRPFEDEDISSGEFFIDKHLDNTMFIGLDLDTYMFPYIPYDGKANEYYVPKDISINVIPQVNTINGGKNYSYINHEDYIEQIHSWFWRLPLVLRQYINIKFDVEIGDRTVMMNLVKKRIPSPNKTVIPKEIQTAEDVDRLLDSYMSHPMWHEKNNIRDLFKATLGNDNYLTRIFTTSENFLDDTANVKRCFLSNLISTLQMMGEDVTLYESGSFEGINDLRDFVRLLSMNHTELIGHVVNDDFDIRVRNDIKGKNVGEELRITDLLHINLNGKIDKVNDRSIIFDEGVDIIVHDRYTHDTKIVTLDGVFKEKNFPSNDKNFDVYPEALPFKNPLSIGDYEHWWGWNLLLPDSFEPICSKIVELSKKLDNNAISRNSHSSIKNEIERLKKIKSDMINGYYSFHLLVPTRDVVRVGNFIDDNFITTRIESNEDWESMWGISHEVLMKILIERGFLGNNRGHDFDKELDKVLQIDVTKHFEKNEIDTIIRVDGQQEQYDVAGSVRVFGEILDKTGNLFRVSCDNGIIATRDTFGMVESSIECFVNDDGSIDETEYEFALLGNRINGSLFLTLGGTVSRPDFRMRVEFDYKPSVTKRVVDQMIHLVSPVYLDDVIQNNVEFVGDIRIFGEIVGAGDNNLLVEFLGGTVLYDGVPQLDENGKPYDNIVLEYDDDLLIEGQQNELHIVVSEDGKIYQKIETYKIINDPNLNLYKSNWESQQRSASVLPDGMMYKYRTCLGEIRLIVDGEVSDIKLKTTSALFVKSPDFIELPVYTNVVDYNTNADNFTMYSPYERRFDNRTYRLFNNRFSEVSLNLTNPIYDFNRGTCQMTGELSISFTNPSNNTNEVDENGNIIFEDVWYPNGCYSYDDDINNYYAYSRSDCSINVSGLIFVFDTVRGDMTNPIEMDVNVSDLSDKLRGKLHITIDGCVDDRIGIHDNPSRDIRIDIIEVEPISGVYAALYDIDDEGEFEIVGLDGRRKVKAKNNKMYPMLDRAGQYNRNDYVEIVVSVDINGVGDAEEDAKTSDTFSLNISLDELGNLKHKNMVFAIDHETDSGTLEGTVTIGLVDSVYKIVDVALEYICSGWRLIGEEQYFEQNTPWSHISGILKLQFARDGGDKFVDELVVKSKQDFNAKVSFENVTIGVFDIANNDNPSGIVYFNDFGIEGHEFENCQILEDGTFVIPNEGLYVSDPVPYQETPAQRSEFNLTSKVTRGELVEIAGQKYIDVHFILDVQTIINEWYTTYERKYRYLWSKPENSIESDEDEDVIVLDFSDDISKVYDPLYLETDGRHISVNGDKPLIENASLAAETETGGLNIFTSAIIQTNRCSMTFEEIPTVVDCIALQGDDVEEGQTGGVKINTEIAVTDYGNDEQSVSAIDDEQQTEQFTVQCDVSTRGIITSKGHVEVEVSGDVERTIMVKDEENSTEGNIVYKEEKYKYEMDSKFTINAQGFSMFDTEPLILGCYNHEFKKIFEEPEVIPPDVMIEYSDGMESVVKKVDLRALENGYNLFKGHVLDNTHKAEDYFGATFVPAWIGNYNRLSSENITEPDTEQQTMRSETAAEVNFYKQFTSLKDTSGMFSGCCVNAGQVRDMVESLYYNKIGGEIEIGVDGQVRYSEDLKDFVNSLPSGAFKVGEPFTITTEPDENGISKEWKITLTPTEGT